MKRVLAILLPALLAAGGATAQQSPASPPRGQVVEARAVLVNDEPISLSDVRKRMQLILMSLGSQPDEETIAQAQQQAIESLIEEKIQVQEFQKLAKDAVIEDAEIDERLSSIAQRNGQTLDSFTAGLAQRGVSIESLRSQIRADIAWSNLIGGRFGRQVRVSEARVDEAMRRLTDSLDKPQYHLAEIFLYAPDATSRANALARAATLKTQIEEGGAAFEQVALQFSAAPTATLGGDLGWMSRGDMRPEFISAVESATPPRVLNPIETEGGVYLLAVVGKREPANPNESVLNLKQAVASGDDAAAKLAQLRSQNLQCPAVNAAAEALGVTVTDIPNVAQSDLTDDIRTAVQPLQPGQSTAPLDVRSGKAVLFICSRQLQGAQIPTRANIKDRLFDQEITMLADRYLRDLKRDATIIRR